MDGKAHLTCTINYIFVLINFCSIRELSNGLSCIFDNLFLLSLVVFMIIFRFNVLQFLGSNVIQLENYKPASVDDIVSVHSKSYVAGLEKVSSWYLLFPFFWGHSIAKVDVKFILKSLPEHICRIY